MTHGYVVYYTVSFEKENGKTVISFNKINDNPVVHDLYVFYKENIEPIEKNADTCRYEGFYEGQGPAFISQVLYSDHIHQLHNDKIFNGEEPFDEKLYESALYVEVLSPWYLVQDIHCLMALQDQAMRVHFKYNGWSDEYEFRWNHCDAVKEEIKKGFYNAYL